jgi:hypothetical protein
MVVGALDLAFTAAKPAPVWHYYLPTKEPREIREFCRLSKTFS